MNKKKEIKRPDLYLYHLASGAFVVRKNPPEDGHTPTWSSRNCDPFTAIELKVIKVCVEGTIYDHKDSLAYGKAGFYYFWGTEYRSLNSRLYEKLVLGCAAHGINLISVKWEG